jgi:hypothetical protein
LTALSENVSVPVLAPVVVGVKLTLIVQFFPAATELPQVLVCEKSPAIEILRVKSAEPLFVRVTFLTGLVVLTI